LRETLAPLDTDRRRVLEMLHLPVRNFIKASILSVGFAAVIASPVYACCPAGTINKSVEDITTSSELKDANTNSDALTVNSGDTLEYVITIHNNGTVESSGNDDMLDTNLTDTLPAGIVLASNPGQTTISDSLGTIAAGKSVTVSYRVTVTSTDNGAYLTNKACYTGNSVNNKDDQNGCDTAVVLVNVPVTPTPMPTPTPAAPITPTQSTPTPVALPNTGPGNVIIPAVFISVLGYIGYMFKVKRGIVD
jgi:uncharacterized repeat protein (TIGR01451 family)